MFDPWVIYTGKLLKPNRMFNKIFNQLKTSLRFLIM